MMTVNKLEDFVRYKRERLLSEAAAERLAAQVEEPRSVHQTRPLKLESALSSLLDLSEFVRRAARFNRRRRWALHAKPVQ